MVTREGAKLEDGEVIAAQRPQPLHAHPNRIQPRVDVISCPMRTRCQDLNDVRNKINSLRGIMGGLMVKRQGPFAVTDDGARPLGPKARQVLSTTFKNGGTYHPNDDFDPSTIGGKTKSKIETSADDYQSLFDVRLPDALHTPV